MWNKRLACVSGMRCDVFGMWSVGESERGGVCYFGCWKPMEELGRPLETAYVLFPAKM